jgi:hypothetical protein
VTPKNTPDIPVLVPSPARLLAGTGVAALIAAVLLVVVILPAEYGIDPTGIGRATGLYRTPEADPAPLSASSVADASDGLPVAGSLLKSPTPFRTDEMTITLTSGEGAEIKAAMAQGERFVFSWTATGGGVDVDMHGESLDAGASDRSYWKGEFEESGHGAFEAPMTGNHGWFWQNLNDDPVTITVKTAGFYRRLFRP